MTPAGQRGSFSCSDVQVRWFCPIDEHLPGSLGRYETFSIRSVSNPHALGGGRVAYHFDNAGARFDPANPGEEQVFKNRSLFQQGLIAVTTDDARAAAAQSRDLLITGNKAPRGAGIGSNGHLTIGEPEVDLYLDKAWQDQDGVVIDGADTSLPEFIEVQLVTEDAAGVQTPIGDPVRVEAGEDGTWSYDFLDLPQYSDGVELNYTVVESAVPGFEVDIVKSTLEDRKYQVNMTNTAGPIDVPVEKVWVEQAGQPLTEGLPESIELQLVEVADDGTTTAVGEPVTLTPDEEGLWTYTFADLPRYRDGAQIAYSVIETPVAGYTSTVAVSTGEHRLLTVTNTAEPEPTPSPTPTPEPTPSPTPTPDGPLSKTGMSGTVPAIGLALLLVAGGALVARRARSES